MRALCDKLNLKTPAEVWWGLRVDYRAWFCVILCVPVMSVWAMAFAWRFLVKVPQ